MKLKVVLLLSAACAAIGFTTGCSESGFTAANGSEYRMCGDVRPGVLCTRQCDANNANCTKKYDYTIAASSQTTDVLFVVDNSGSMYPEQLEIANKFPSFLNIMQGIDYHIGITTTDVAASTNNTFQNGNLIPFPNGSPFLSGNLPATSEQGLFQQTMARQETLLCQQSGFNKAVCPSGDERGILSAALVNQLNPFNFIRGFGHMAVVFLTDEDEGSNGTIVDNRENPQTFVQDFRNRYPNKSIKAHSIIIEPNTQRGRNCFLASERDTQNPPGQYGALYAELSNLTSGLTGDICANDYRPILEAIAAESSQFREVLPCAPINGQVSVSYLPASSGVGVQASYQPFQNEILFSRSLPRGTSVRFQFECVDNGL